MRITLGPEIQDDYVGDYPQIRIHYRKSDKQEAEELRRVILEAIEMKAAADAE